MKPILLAALGVVTVSVAAAELHVAKSGNDTNPGTEAAALLTIQRAAELAQPGDTITVHDGVYRERITPPRGGLSDDKRITYQAAKGKKVVIAGSELVAGWQQVANDTWQVVRPNSFFGQFNPYRDLIRGDWFNPRKREHHTGAVYLDGHWLTEAASQKDVMNPADGAKPLWFAKVDEANTTIWAQFPGVNPNNANVEINVRQTVFTPEKTGVNYITVRGFTLRNAATPWAPPTAGQIGLITAYWCQGWIIESNDIAYSTCSGIALGKYSDEFDNTSANSAEGYVKTVERAQSHSIPWNNVRIGRHIVRNNHISHCEQTGIVGSLGCSFSTVTGNDIHDIHIRQLFGGAEMAGIKFHGAIDTEISQNHIHRSCRGIWLDWMAQGARVTGNLLHDNNTNEDLFLEVNHGPHLVDNNIFLSTVNLLDWSEGGAFAHNLFAGKIVAKFEPNRRTPYHQAHSTTMVGLANVMSGDNRFYNNLFVGKSSAVDSEKASPKNPARGEGFGLVSYDKRTTPLQAGGNAYYAGAQPSRHEAKPLVLADKHPPMKLERKDGQLNLQCDFGVELQLAGAALVTSTLLGNVKIPNLPFENADGTPLAIDVDYFGNPREQSSVIPGPFSRSTKEMTTFKVWDNPPHK